MTDFPSFPPGLFNFPPVDEELLASICGSHLIKDADFRSALVALDALVEGALGIVDRQVQVIKESEDVIERARAHGSEAVDHAIGSLEDECQHHAFLDAAVTHACIGGLAPFFEGLFRTLLKGTRDQRKGEGFIEWVYSVLEDAKEAAPFAPHRNALDALFCFRNKALHNGYEFPVEDRARFMKAVESKKWTNWFPCTTSGRPEAMEVWIIYPSREFLRLCVQIGWDCLNSINRSRTLEAGLAGVQRTAARTGGAQPTDKKPPQRRKR